MRLRRRSLLALPALATAAGATTAFAQPASAPPKAYPPISAAIAQFVTAVRYDDLPAAAVQAAKQSLLDAVAVSMAAAALEPTCKPFYDLALMEGGAPQASLFGRKERLPAAQAAYVNGSLAHALDYEDVHDPSGMHPNAAVVPAALAMAQAQGGVSGRELLTAIAIGCDLTCRLGLARTENLNKYGWYFPPIASAFGATAACARLLKLDARQVMDAMSIALCQISVSSEIVNAPDSHIRAVRDAFPAQLGVRAAYLGRAGVRGFDKPFEGVNGFITMYGHGRYDADRLLKDLGARFHGEEVSFKAWPACRGTHLYIQAILELMARERIDPTQVVAIDAKVESLNVMLCEPFASKRAPSTAIDAKFSIPFAIGAAMVTREITLNSFSPDALKDPRILAVAATVAHTVDEKAAQTTADGGSDFLTVRLRDGRSFACKVDHLLGSPGKRLADADLMAKFYDCASQAPVAPSPAVLKRFAAQVMTLETLPDARRLALFA